MSASLFTEIEAVLTRAGRGDLAERLRAEFTTWESGETADTAELLTTSQAAKILGVSSPNTVKNWLEGGMFPGAFRTRGGHWRFPRSEVERARERMEELRSRNASGDISPPDTTDESEPPLL